ncbi:MAG: metallopeptidase family protein [Acidipropionibacterium sp.]|jgi:predicted Zn-dependent protease with MMP-like domain|nr:metallopeptidase family protein [Acidipropionibacterium sp.]
MAVEMSEAEFEACIDDALDRIPPRLSAAIDNVVIEIAEEPDEGQPPTLLGLYEGVPLTRRDSSWGFVPPDVITIFSGPLSRICSSREELVEQITITVIHEVAHHFGVSDARLHELGWG